MTAKVGDFRDGFLWILNAQGNGYQNAGVGEHVSAYGGLPGDHAIVGNWNGQSCTQGCFNIGIYRSSTQIFILDYNGDMIMGGGDKMFTLSIAQAADIPVTGDWNGDGKTKVGLFRPSTCEWFLDYDGDYVWNSSLDKHYTFGRCGPSGADIPVVGDWNGSGTSKIGVFRSPQTWLLDYNGTGNYNTAQNVTYGYSFDYGPTPVVGNWYGGSIAQLGQVFNDFEWCLDTDGNHQIGSTGDLDFAYGGTDGKLDIPIVGNWTQVVPPSNATGDGFDVKVNNIDQGSNATVPYGTSAQLSFTFNDPVNGYTAISNGEVYLDSGNGVHKCDFQWSTGYSAGYLSAFTYLLNSSNGYSNNECRVLNPQVTYDPASLGELTLTLTVQFTGVASGTNTVYSIVYDTLGQTTSWGQAGTITIPQLPVNLSSNGAFVTGAYLAVLGRAPSPYGDQANWIAWVNGLTLGTMTRDDVINSLLATGNGYPPDNTAFLTTLFQNALQRPPTSAELNGFLAQLASGTPRAQIVATVMNLSEFASVNSYWINNSGMPQTTPPIVLGGFDNTTGYRPLLTSQPQYTYVTVSDPALYGTGVQSGYVWFVSTDANGNITQQCPVSFNVTTRVVQVESTGQSNSTVTCTVSSGAITGWTTLNVSFYVTFFDSGAGNYTILANATDIYGIESPWTTLGTWSMYTPNTNPTPTFTLSIDPSQQFPINLLAQTNGGPVVPLYVDVNGYNNFNCPVTFTSLTNGILANGSGVPGRLTVNLQATVAGITSFILWGASGNCGAGSAQGAQLSVPLTTALPPPTSLQTITATPENHGLNITIDGASCPTPCAMPLIQGTTHAISAPSPQNPIGSTFVFTGWADGVTQQTRNITAGTSPAIYTAIFTMQSGPTLNTVPNGPLTFPDGRLSSDDVPVPHDRTANRNMPNAALAIPLVGSFDFYRDQLKPGAGQYSLSTADFKSLEKVVSLARAWNIDANAYSPQHLAEILKLSLTQRGLASINRFLSTVVAGSVHVIGAVNRTGVLMPDYQTIGDMTQCGQIYLDKPSHAQAAGYDCEYSAELLGFWGTNQIGGKSWTFCTGDCSYLTAYVSQMVGTYNLGLSGEKRMGGGKNEVKSGSSLAFWDGKGWNGGAWDSWISSDIQPGYYTQQSIHSYTTTYTDQHNNIQPLTLAPPFSYISCGIGYVCNAQLGFEAQTAKLWGQISLGFPTSSPSESTSSDYYVLKNCANKVGLYAFISFPNAPNSLITWTATPSNSIHADTAPGHNSNFYRLVDCTNPGDVNVSFSLNGHQMASATVHVMNPITININNTETNADDIAILPRSGNQPVLVPVTITSTVTTQVELISTPAGRVSIPCTTCALGKHGGPLVNLTANTPMTMSINPLQISSDPNDVTINAYIGDTSVGSANMTVASVGIPTIQHPDTPPGMPPRIPPNAPTTIQISVQPNLANSVQALTLATSGTSDLNGNFSIGGGATQVLVSTTNVTLQGTTQTAPTGDAVPPTANDRGGGNAGNLQVLVQAGTLTVASSNGFSVAAIPTGGWTDAFSDSGGFALIGGRYRSVVVNPEYYGIQVNDSWLSDSGAIADVNGVIPDLEESYVSEQIQVHLGTDVGSLKGGHYESGVYNSAKFRSEDTHALDAGLFKAAGAVTIDQVHIIADRRTGAWNVPMPNSGFTITSTLFFTDQGLLQLKTTKQAAQTTANNFTSGPGNIVPDPTTETPGTISHTVEYH